MSAKRGSVGVPERKKIQDAVMELKSIHAARKEIEDAYPEVVDKLDGLAAAEAAVTSLVKDAVRTISEPGRTLTVFDDPDLYISVCGKYAPKEYDVEKAEKAWPKEVFDLVVTRSIDTKAVEVLLQARKLTDKQAEEALMPAKLATPAVSIKVRS